MSRKIKYLLGVLVFVYVIALIIFHATYSYGTYWVDEPVIIFWASVLYIIIGAILYFVLKRKTSQMMSSNFEDNHTKVLENQGRDELTRDFQEERPNLENQELDVQELKQQDKIERNEIFYAGTGIRTLRAWSIFLIILGIILFLIGFIQIGDSNRFHPERLYIGIYCFSGALSCFIFSPICKVLATIGEAAKIYKDKNTN